MPSLRQKSATEESAVIIEAAVTPFRPGEPILHTDGTIREAIDCLEAGAGIVHHHHDMRHDQAAGIDEMITTSSSILAAQTEALIYTDYLRGKLLWEKYAHLAPMADAGVLRMIAIDPGLTLFAGYDELGRPVKSATGGLRFPEAHEMVEFAKQHGAPLSIGVYEPGHLRWILTYERTAGFPPGSIIKLYFGGEYNIDQVGVKGMNFGLPPTKAALDIYLEMMAGSQLPFVVSLLGGVILDSPLARYTLERGGHIRVGVEDTGGMTAMTNRETVETAVALAAEVGRPVAAGANALATLASTTA